MLATFPTLTADEKALVTVGRKFKAVKSYYDRVRITLDGVETAPTLATAKTVVDAFAMGFDIPLAVEDGSYRDLAAEAKKASVISDRYVLFCAEDGIVNSRKAGHASSCDNCRKVAPKGESLTGTMFYAPDAMAYPTPVLFYCSECE